MIVRSSDGKIIGDIENYVFTKRVRGSVHMLRVPPGWGIDAEAFVKSVLPLTDKIRIEDVENGSVYEIATRVFDDKKFRLKRKFGIQFVVTLNYWHEIRKGQKVLL